MNMEMELPTAGTAVIQNTMVQLPQWVIELHHFRKELFLSWVEPLIVYILGPIEEENLLEGLGIVAPPSTSASGHGYDFAQPYDANYEYDHDTGDRRKLSFLPNYVADAAYVRETSMSFASLVMLFTIMTCILLVFLSCFYHNQKTSPLFASPRRHRLPRLVPPPLPVDKIFSWIRVCFYMSDEEVSF